MRQQRGSLSLALTTVALALWASSILGARVEAINDLGLIAAMPVQFFLALGLLTAASAILWFSPQQHGRLLCFQLCLFITFLWATPLVIGSTLVGTRYIYALHTLTEYILRYGHLDPISQWYHNWPGTNILESVLLLVSGIRNADFLLTISSLLMQFLLLAPLYLLFRRTTKGNHAWAAAWLFYLGNWTGQTYFSPQGMGFFLFLLLLALVFKPVAGAVASRFQQILIFASLTMTHLLTAIAGVFVAAANSVRQRHFAAGSLPVLFGVIVAIWTIYQTTAYFEGNVPVIAEHAFRFDLIWGQNVSVAVRGSDGHEAVVLIRILLTALFAVIGLAGLALSWKWKSTSDGTFLAIGAGILLMVPFSLYQSEFFMRVYLFGLPVLAYFGVRLLRNRASAILLILAVLIAIPLSIISLHGNQAMDRISPGQRAYWHFLEDKTQSGHLAGGGIVMEWTFGYAGRYTKDWTLLDEADWHQYLPTGEWLRHDKPNYVAPTDYEQLVYELVRGDPSYVREMREWLARSPDYHLIYQDPETRAYIFAGE